MKKNILSCMSKLSKTDRYLLVRTFQEVERGKYNNCDIIDLQLVSTSVALCRLTTSLKYYKKEYPYREDYIIPLYRLKVKLGAKLTAHEKRKIRKFEKENDLIPVTFEGGK